MKKRLFNLASLISTALAGCTLILSASTFFVPGPLKPHLSFSERFHVSVWRRRDDATPGRLVFFNHPQYPYQGSSLTFGDRHLDRDIGWGDFMGVYYRYFHWDDGRTLWTLTVSFWYPLFLFSVLPAVWIYRNRRLRRLLQGAVGMHAGESHGEA